MTKPVQSLIPPPGTPGTVFNGSNTITIKDKRGHAVFKVVQQGDRITYLDRTGHRLGYINSQGKTLSARDQLLAYNPRPDLLLCQQKLT